MKRSMTPLHSGSPTYDGVMVIPSHFTSLIHASAMYCGPQSHRIRSPPRDVLRAAAEDLAHPLAQWLERSPAIADLGGVPAHELIDAVIDGPEEPAPAVLFGVEACRVGAPHLIRPRGGDRAGVRRIAIRRSQTPRREQMMLSHQPQDALPAEGQAAMRQARPDLAIPLAMERARREHRADRLHDLGITVRRLGPTLGGRPWHDGHRGRCPVDCR